MLYQVNDIYPAIQGEGTMTGVPMVLLRLHGCPVGCPFCDTRETWVVDPAHRVDEIDAALGTNEKWAEVSADDIARYISVNYPALSWVLLTGGEPGMQNLAPLVDKLHWRGYQVAIETSGTAGGVLESQCDWLCVSPKIGMPGGREIIQDVIDAAHEIKFVIGKQADIDRAVQMVKQWGVDREWTQTISLQPMSANKRATELCIATAMRLGWRLSIQIHKFIGQR